VKITLDSYSKKALYCHMTTGRKIMDWKLIGYRIAEFGTALLIFVSFYLWMIIANI
jgi:hypothetical protein